MDKYISSTGVAADEPRYLESENGASREIDPTWKPTKQDNVHYQLMSSIFEDLKLMQNPRFKAFIADITVNTCDLSRWENLPNYQIKYFEQSLKELLDENLPRAPGLSDRQYKEANGKYRENRAQILSKSHDPFEEEMFKKISAKFVRVQEPSRPNTIVLPVLDRFLNLLATLKDPSLVKKSEYLKNNFITELGMSGANYQLVEDAEYMAKWQVVALAKNHNFFGGMDSYMKEFANICMETKDQGLIRNLEALLNTEISLK